MAPGEKAAAMAKDPVPLFRQRLIDEGAAQEAELAALEAEIQTEVNDAVTFALESAAPGLEELDRDVYAEERA
jgi:pyruvate dehydrogenase E1 component alpha subunit